MRTWLAIVRRDADGHEANIKVSSKQWYYDTKQHVRDFKAKRMTERYENAAKADREKVLDQLGFMVSPKSMCEISSLY